MKEYFFRAYYEENYIKRNWYAIDTNLECLLAKCQNQFYNVIFAKAENIPTFEIGIVSSDGFETKLFGSNF